MELSPQTYHQLAALIHRETGIVLGADKAYLVRHRLEPLLAAEALDNFEILLRRLHLRDSARLRHAVINAITVQETRFFRDQPLFDALFTRVLPACAGPVGARNPVAIWSAAVATGQEAYSLAMLVREFAPATGAGHFTILGTDVSSAALATAKAAHYSNADIRRGLSEARVARHMEQRGERWHVREPVRRLVRFAPFNLLHPPAELGLFDLILCRNVLIYFDDATRRKVCHGLYAALRPGGWLALGSAESLHGIEGRFATAVHGRAVLYRKPR